MYGPREAASRVRVVVCEAHGVCVMIRGGCASAWRWHRRGLWQKEIRANYVKPTLEMLYYTYLHEYYNIPTVKCQGRSCF